MTSWWPFSLKWLNSKTYSNDMFTMILSLNFYLIMSLKKYWILLRFKDQFMNYLTCKIKSSLMISFQILQHTIFFKVKTLELNMNKMEIIKLSSLINQCFFVIYCFLVQYQTITWNKSNKNWKLFSIICIGNFSSNKILNFLNKKSNFVFLSLSVKQSILIHTIIFKLFKLLLNQESADKYKKILSFKKNFSKIKWLFLTNKKVLKEIFNIKKLLIWAIKISKTFWIKSN